MLFNQKFQGFNRLKTIIVLLLFWGRRLWLIILTMASLHALIFIILCGSSQQGFWFGLNYVWRDLYIMSVFHTSYVQGGIAFINLDMLLGSYCSTGLTQLSILAKGISIYKTINFFLCTTCGLWTFVFYMIHQSQLRQGNIMLISTIFWSIYFYFSLWTNELTLLIMTFFVGGKDD